MRIGSVGADLGLATCRCTPVRTVTCFAAAAAVAANTAINVVELKVIDGKLMYEDVSQPTYIDLGDQREPEK